jgi:hypothetical protein
VCFSEKTRFWDWLYLTWKAKSTSYGESDFFATLTRGEWSDRWSKRADLFQQTKKLTGRTEI